MTSRIHTRIRDTRLSQGLSQIDLAELTGVSQPTVTHWENGSHAPRPATLEKISTALNVETAWLITGTRSGALNPAMQYLSLPVRHVPVHVWPANLASIPAECVSYVPHASDSDALMAFRSDGVFAPEGHILVFDFNVSPQDTPSTFLTEGPNGLMVKTPDTSGRYKMTADEHTLARLCAVIQHF